MSVPPMVKDIMNLITQEFAVVRKEASLSEVLREMLRDPKTQSVYVVNEKDELVGIITLDIALQYLYGQYIPPEYLQFDISLLQGTGVKAEDIMAPPVYVKEDETLKDAFVKMFRYHLNELPVVDETNHVIGDLHALELIEIGVKEQGY